jgi:phage terminase Nu1 subunit (DNA packaging protein)
MKEMSRRELAELFGEHEREVGRWADRGMPITRSGQHGDAWCANPTACIGWRIEEASARGDVARERARHYRAAAELKELELAQLRRESAPVSLLTTAIARGVRQARGILDAVAPALRRRSSNLTAQDLELVDAEIARACAAIAAITIEEDAGEDEKGDGAHDEP